MAKKRIWKEDEKKRSRQKKQTNKFIYFSSGDCLYFCVTHQSFFLIVVNHMPYTCLCRIGRLKFQSNFFFSVFFLMIPSKILFTDPVSYRYTKQIKLKSKLFYINLPIKIFDDQKVRKKKQKRKINNRIVIDKRQESKMRKSELKKLFFSVRKRE